jgi:hypothetical protein
MNIYLDIDGVLLTKQGQPSPHLKELLIEATTGYTPYWLTTHCKGDLEHVQSHLKIILPQDLWSYIEMIKPTNWDVLKTDSIDFTQDFIWLDDAPMEAEKKVLESHGVLHKLRLVDLKNNPDQLLTILNE